MREMTGMDYLKIDIANHYGLDRLTWQERLDWTNKHIEDDTLSLQNAKDPFLFAKAINALKLTEQGIATGHWMALDATASGYQIMCALSGDYQGASNVNLINTGTREDLYQHVADEMNTHPAVSLVREDIKKGVMVVGYGSKKEPEKIFGKDTPELESFYKALYYLLPGAMELMNDLMDARDVWNATEYKWTLPDGHRVVSKIMQAEHKRLKIDNLGGKEIIYNMYVNKPDPGNRSLAANVIHSIDGWIVREMHRKAKEQKFLLATIHDAFIAHPNYMNQVRRNYVEIMAWLADNNPLNTIFKEITNNPAARYTQITTKLGDYIRKSEYALS